MKLVPLTQQHIDAMKGRSLSYSVVEKLPNPNAWNLALEHDGKTIMIGGVDCITHSTAWAWIDMTAEAKTNIITCYRVIREWLDEIAKEGKLRRIEAYVLVGFEEGVRMIEHLNFHEEHIMPNFYGDRPAHLYVRYYNW